LHGRRTFRSNEQGAGRLGLPAPSNEDPGRDRRRRGGITDRSPERLGSAVPRSGLSVSLERGLLQPVLSLGHVRLQLPGRLPALPGRLCGDMPGPDGAESEYVPVRVSDRDDPLRKQHLLPAGTDLLPGGLSAGMPAGHAVRTDRLLHGWTGLQRNHLPEHLQRATRYVPGPVHLLSGDRPVEQRRDMLSAQHHVSAQLHHRGTVLRLVRRLEGRP